MISTRHTEEAGVFERASAWVARLEAHDCTPEERERFEDWLAEDTRHVKAWVQAETLYQQSAGLAQDPWLRTAAARAARPARRRWLPGVAAAAALCLAIGMGWMVATDGNPTPRIYANDSLAPRQQTLADGSSAILDAGTTLTVRMGWRHRELVLEQGRLQLQVAPSRKALRVQAGSSSIRDIGTTFQVERLRDGHVEVALLEGAVEVTSGSAQHTLAPGQQLQVLPSGRIQPGPALASTEAAEAWLQGRLVFDATPLATVVERMNRYGRTQMVIADPEIANLAVSGTFRAGDAEELLSALELGWSVAGQARPDGALELRRTY
ncbi:FecR domain-containing protein [Stenotrophomonas maltophilia]|uniref:FecR family protein n=1 Tax=Stenotrophomonas maltophilia TaxID=40324 RepID=UPI0021C58169|nr:FecR domain-containing protein [Stenotrophomonas maltophilia]MCU1091666.1 FecR domain-containing protein [Stenotrophomonas maltophilia]HEL3865477.1 FecR domain-containing protein [Stenotrophomonas maltophilia]HEL4289886.1 FecR domain-containing protein [Stenotrophomonas maltophilia]